MMPRQDCPMCGNRPRVFIERQNERIMEDQQRLINALRVKVKELQDKLKERDGADHRESLEDYYAGQHE